MASGISARRTNARKSGDDDYEKRRLKLVEVAAEVFREKGYHAANVDEIARRAGIDRASIYYYYKGKKELFREMIAEAVSDNVGMAEAIAGSTEPPTLKLRSLIDGLFTSYEKHYPYLYVYVQEDMAGLVNDRSAWSRSMRSLNRRFDQAVVSIVEEGLEAGAFVSKGDARLIAAGVIGMCNWSHRWFEPAGRYRREQVVEVFSRMVLNGLAVDDRASS